MENEFSSIMASRSDKELIKILTKEKESYQPEAILAAQKEVESRSIDTVKFQEIESDLISDEVVNEKLSSKKVTMPTRLLNMIVDSIIIIFVSLVLLNIYDIIIITSPQYRSAWPAYLIYFIVFTTYYTLLEGIGQQTIGKFITKTKVINSDGQKPNMIHIFSRTIYRLIPFDALSFIFTDNGLHDYLSKTTIVKTSFTDDKEGASNILDDDFN